MITASVILYKHTIKSIAPLLRSLVGSDVQELYVIDQGPLDRVNDIKADIKEWIASNNVTLHFTYSREKNDGYGPGHNIAIKRAMAAGAKYHIVLNPDVEFNKDAITVIAQHMDNHEDVGQVMPKVYYPNGVTQRLCKLLPRPTDMVARLCAPKFFAEKRLELFELVGSGYNKVMNVPYLSGCFMFFRIDALKEVGLFDERFFMYAEDIDITRRMHARYRTEFYPEVSIIHLHNRADRRSKRLLWVHIINIVKYFNKWGWWHDKQRDEFNNRILEELSLKN